MNTFADSLALAAHLVWVGDAELWRIVALSLRVSLAACAVGPTPNKAASAPVACPESRVPAHVRLHGRWRATWGGQTGWLVLGPSPENPDGWRGTLQADRPGAAPVLIAGDLDEQGQFTLEESSDGRRISANWDGQPVEGTCLAEVRGLRREAGAESSCRTCPVNACTHHAETPAEMMIAAE